jgi:hypothetical protein
VYNVRCFLRLWGLVRIYERARDMYNKPSRDAIIKLLGWAQIGVKATYQILENGAFLTTIGVFRSRKWLERETRWWTLSNKVWLLYVALEGLRLLRVRQLRFNEDFGAEDVKTQSEGLRRKWNRDFYAAAGWVAPAIYLSHADALESPVSEAWMGASGLIPSIIAMQDAWRKSAQLA